MITQNLIDTKVSAACARLGSQISNANFWQTTGLTEAQILAEIVVMEQEEASATGNPFELLKAHFRKHAYDEFAFLALKEKRDSAQSPIQKVEDIYLWQSIQLGKALQGMTNFDLPPHTFTEVINA